MVASFSFAEREALPSGPFTENVSWIETGPEPVLLIEAAPKLPVTVLYRATLAELEYTWEDEGTTDEAGDLFLPVFVPESAWMHPASDDFVTDLRVMIDLDGHVTVAPPAVLVWPSGLAGGAALWTVADAAKLAPNGTLRDDLREGVGPDERIMPDVSDVVGPREPLDAERDSGVSP